MQKDKEQDLKDNQSNFSPQVLTQNQKLHIENAFNLSKTEKKAFVSFLVNKRGINNIKAFMKVFFLEQLNKNELKDFKELYKEFLMRNKSQEISKI